jgi:TonB family protein
LKPDPKKTKKAQEDAMKRLEALEKIERMTKSQQAAARPAPVKGNQISRGGSLTGVIRLEQQGYLESVHSVVQARWNLPSFLSGANLKARVRIFVDGKGTVIKRSITQSSGNDIFDARLLAAIDASSPLQPPPESLVGILEVDGLELGFEP